MKEEKESFFGKLKNQIITGVGVILTALGTMFIDEVKSFIGIEDEDTAGVEVVQENKQEVNVEGPTIVVNIPEQKPVKERVIVKEVPVEDKKEKEEEIDW